MDLGIEGRVALVMGASQGIGKAIAAALAREGARVAIASRSAERLAEAAAEIGAGTVTLVADATDSEELARLPMALTEALGPVEILVLNTGGPPPGGALDHGFEEWEDACRSLVLAPRILAGGVLPAMRARAGAGSSTSAPARPASRSPTSASPTPTGSAAVGFLKTLAGEVAADGITVNTVATGKFATDRLIELGGSREAVEEMARAGSPRRPPRPPRGVRRPRRLPLLRPRRLPDRHRHPPRRRPHQSRVLTLLSS